MPLFSSSRTNSTETENPESADDQTETALEELVADLRIGEPGRVAYGDFKRLLTDMYLEIL